MSGWATLMHSSCTKHSTISDLDRSGREPRQGPIEAAMAETGQGRPCLDASQLARMQTHRSREAKFR